MENAAPKNRYHYNPKLKPLAKAMRKKMNKAEACLWKYQLQRGQMLGYTFLRQRPVLNYIVDFMCKELMLVIEVDGFTHDTEEMIQKDAQRDKDLQEIGFTVLRFSNWEVLHQMASVSEILVKWIKEQEGRPSEL